MIGSISRSNAYSQKVKTSSVDILLKLSLGLILLTIISTALVYAQTISVDVDGTSYDVEYTAKEMSVSGIEADLDFTSLILSVDVSENGGTLNITFERSFFDSLDQGEDAEFYILADGDEPPSTEISTNSLSRTLSIELSSGTEEVEIIGSVLVQNVEEPPMETPSATRVEPPYEEPLVEIPSEIPLVEIPSEIPLVEIPSEIPSDQTQTDEVRVDVPSVETPIKEPSMGVPAEELSDDDKPRTQCGPGTFLKDGVCTLDETCGPGTVLEDGVCVLDSAPASSSGYFKGFTKELGYGVVAAFIVAGAVGVILALMSKVSKRRN